MIEIGKQYSKDDKLDLSGFLSKARLHQSKFRANNLKVACDEYGNYLKEEDAAKGLNFYGGLNVFEKVKKRFPNYSKQRCANMLRSEHIPFNLFAPLTDRGDLAKIIFSRLIDKNIKIINNIKIEFAPKSAKSKLNDGTAFDAYIEFTLDNDEKGFIGIEVKYTERSYALKKGSTEMKRVNDSQSSYYQVTNQSGKFKENIIEELKKDEYRQIWRNQLLGESLLQTNSKFKHFHSMVFVPKGNTYIQDKVKAYNEFLIDFKIDLVLYEEYFDELITASSNDKEIKKWIDYLRKRYIVV